MSASAFRSRRCANWPFESPRVPAARSSSGSHPAGRCSPGPAIQLSFNQQKQIFGSVVDLSDQLRNARITLYAVDPLGAEESLSRDLYYQAFLDGVVKPRDVNIGNLALQVFAAQTGGLVINSNDVTEMLQRSMRDTTAYYEITYKPGPAEHLDEYHHIQVQIARPGVTARTLRGYYAQP